EDNKKRREDFRPRGVVRPEHFQSSTTQAAGAAFSKTTTLTLQQWGKTCQASLNRRRSIVSRLPFRRALRDRIVSKDERPGRPLKKGPDARRRTSDDRDVTRLYVAGRSDRANDVDGPFSASGSIHVVALQRPGPLAGPGR